VDRDGFVYVTDTGNHRVQKFDRDGNFETQWGGFGGARGQFNFPYGLAVDRRGAIFVLDSSNFRVQQFMTAEEGELQLREQDDVALVPAKSSVVPAETETRTQLSRRITINIPVISAAMDTVTEARLAIAIAREGGIGIIHRVLSAADQAAEVDKVKKSESGMILNPVTISPDHTIRDAHKIMELYRISGIP